MIYFLLILLLAAGIFCFYFAIACIVAASRENALPDMEDIEIGKTIS